MVALRLPLVALVSNLLPRSWLLLSLWLSFNGLIYWNTYRSYKGQPQYYYLYRMLGSGLCMSRGTGAVLNVSCCLVLLPVCQWTGTLMRTLAVRVTPYLVRLLMNQAKMLHTTCAVTILVASAVHTGAHVANAFHFSRHYNLIWTEINVADYPNQDPLEMVVTTVPGITGLLMVLILAALALTATSCFRRRHYNVFYYIHLLYAPFLLLLIFHPLSGMMKEQVNIEEHVPGCDPEGMLWPNRSSSSNTKNNSTHCLTAPIFVSMSTRTWVWVSIPLALYLADLGIRRWRRHQPVDISRVVFHQGDILELHVNKWMPKCFPGQYVLLQCVDISAFEWHPFSLSSCCDLTHPQWTVHIKTSGDWCTRFRDLLMARQYGESRKLKLYVDGPFGGPIADALRSEIVVFIAGGIGISPYLSVVHHLIRNGWPSRPKRLHLIWIVPKIEHLWWAAAPFVQLIEDVWSSSVPDKLEVSFHVTGTPVKDCRDLSSANLLRTTYPSVFHRVRSGRPDWTQLFSIWTDIYRGESVKVFSCGPKKLNRQIRKLCGRHNASKTSFTFIHEHFS